jgi:hypothetical protein
MAMLNKWTFLVLGLLIAIVAAVSYACGDDEPSEAEAVAQLCADLNTLQTADAAFDDLGPGSTINEIQAANAAYNGALDDAIKSGKDVAAVRIQPIETAYDDLDQAISDISGDATIPEALLSISDELSAVDAAYASAFSGVDCS